MSVDSKNIVALVTITSLIIYDVIYFDIIFYQIMGLFSWLSYSTPQPPNKEFNMETRLVYLRSCHHSRKVIDITTTTQICFDMLSKLQCQCHFEVVFENRVMEGLCDSNKYINTSLIILYYSQKTSCWILRLYYDSCQSR